MSKDDFNIHDSENNPESETHLKENNKKFSKQCLKVMELLHRGIRLTTINAVSYGILSLPRRILDLKENGIKIDEQWLLDDNGKRTIKEWYILQRIERPTKKEVAERWSKKLKENPPNFKQLDLL